MGECALLKPAVSLIHAFTTSVPEHWKTFGQLYYRVDHPEPQQFQLADFNWRNNSHMFRLAMRCRLSARRSGSALPIAKVSHSFRVDFGWRGKRHSGRIVGYTESRPETDLETLIRIEVNKDRSTNLCTGCFCSVLCLRKDPVAGERSN